MKVSITRGWGTIDVLSGNITEREWPASFLMWIDDLEFNEMNEAIRRSSK